MSSSAIYTHWFNGPFSRTTQVSRYQKGKTNLDFTEARDSEWQWHQLGHMQVSTSLQRDNHASTPPLSFLQAGCPSCRPTNSVKALKANGIWRSQQYSPDVEDNKDTMEPVNSNCDHSTIMLSVHPMLSTWQPNVQRLFVYNSATQVIYI